MRRERAAMSVMPQRMAGFEGILFQTGLYGSNLQRRVVISCLGWGREVTITSDSVVANISLGQVLEAPLSWRLDLEELRDLVGGHFDSRGIEIELFNSPEIFVNEGHLAEYHGFNNKQTAEYNPRGSLNTALIKVSCDDFEGEELMWRIHYSVNSFLGNFLAGFWGFLQRRRIAIGCVNLIPQNSQFFWLAGTGYAGEFLDSTGWGQIAIPVNELQNATEQAIRHYLDQDGPAREKVVILYRRYNDILHLPYAYERFDGLWRIVECLGKEYQLSEEHAREFRDLLVAVGVPNGSKTLKFFFSALKRSGKGYNFEEIGRVFHYRNRSTHEYLSKSVIDDRDLSENLHFMNDLVDLLVLRESGVAHVGFIPARFHLIMNRVF